MGQGEAVDALDILVCPVCRGELNQETGRLVCSGGHRFPVVEGVAVLLRDDARDTIGLAAQSRRLADAWANGDRTDPYFIDSVGCTDAQRVDLEAAIKRGDWSVDPVISYLIAATNGHLYARLVGKLDEPPVPNTRLPDGAGRRLVDIGCSWGRWSMATAAKGWRPVGVDPSLGAVLAARRLAKSRGLPFEGVVGDARFLPLRDGCVDAGFSYSVLQHFSKPDAQQAFAALARSVREGGLIRIQMAAMTGIRSLQHIVQRGFREPRDFEVRYWLPWELEKECRAHFGAVDLEVDCYFGLGLQASDAAWYGALGRTLVAISEILRTTSKVFPPLKYCADSLYIVAKDKRTPKRAASAT